MANYAFAVARDSAVAPSGSGLLNRHLGYLLQPRNSPDRPVRINIDSPHSSQERTNSRLLKLKWIVELS